MIVRSADLEPEEAAVLLSIAAVSPSFGAVALTDVLDPEHPVKITSLGGPVARFRPER